MVLNRFGASIDFDKYLSFILEETKTNSAMKNPEIHSAMMGRMMCVSAIVDSQWITNAKQMGTLIDVLGDIYHAQEFLREAIQLVVVKIIKSPVGNIKLFDYVLTKLRLTEIKVSST